MAYQIYESHCGDMRKFTFPNDRFHLGGQEYLSRVSYYVTDSSYKDYWIAVCDNGHITKIEPKKVSPLLKDKKILKVGYLAEFHRQLSEVVRKALLTGKQFEEETQTILKNRRRCLWTKEYRGV